MTFGRLAGLDRQKGFDEVLEVLTELLKSHPDLVYLIVGDGPDRQRLQAKAQALGVSAAVVFAGRIAEDEKVDHYRLADLYVMPSRGEGFGIVCPRGFGLWHPGDRQSGRWHPGSAAGWPPWRTGRPGQAPRVGGNNKTLPAICKKRPSRGAGNLFRRGFCAADPGNSKVNVASVVYAKKILEY